MEELKIESVPGDREVVRILRLSGPFTLRNVFDFQSVFRSETATVTLIDVTNVPYMDSAALGAILSVHTSSEKNGRQYALVGVDDRMRTLFEVGGVSGILVTYPTLEEAQQKLASKAASR
jgi:anti-anti-sigma factor